MSKVHLVYVGPKLVAVFTSLKSANRFVCQYAEHHGHILRYIGEGMYSVDPLTQNIGARVMTTCEGEIDPAPWN
jgi:hypothetical protein